jgi:hypothetical protein
MALLDEYNPAAKRMVPRRQKKVRRRKSLQRRGGCCMGEVLSRSSVSRVNSYRHASERFFAVKDTQIGKLREETAHWAADVTCQGLGSSVTVQGTRNENSDYLESG